MSFIDKMKEAGEDIKEAFQDGAHDLADKAGDLKDAATPADKVVAAPAWAIWWFRICKR